MKKAIVTGSNGFVGSNVCKRLCADGVKVFAVVKDENEKIDNIEKLDGIEIVYCELDEIETLFDKISDRDVDVFYHFAWVGSAGPLRCDENIQLQNALWTARALRIADKMQCKKFVNAGSIMEKKPTQRFTHRKANRVCRTFTVQASSLPVLSASRLQTALT